MKETLRRALQSLEKHDHIEFLAGYAGSEYKFGDCQKGRTNFENILSGFPKKSEIWNRYLDMEIKYGKEQEGIRFLFDKVCSLPWKEKQIKGFFKKYLNYELREGTPKTQERVRNLAREYVEKNNRN